MIKKINISTVILILLFTATTITQQYTYAQTTFKTYKDPASKFSIEYPSNWIVKPKENRFQILDVKFYRISSSSVANGSVAVAFKTIPTQQLSTQQLSLPNAFTTFLNGFSSTIPNFIQVGDTSYTKYKVAGHDAASIEFSSSPEQTQGFNLAGLVVFSIINHKAFVLMYVADQNIYDKVLPNIEYMIKSFQPL
jgi:PsbP-like protein